MMKPVRAHHCGAFVLILVTAPAMAAHTLDLGHGITAEGSLKLIAGTALRTESPSNDILFPGNDPSGRGGPNSDDGDLNYDSGDFVKGSGLLYGSLKFSYSNYGIMLSGQTWQDYLENKKSVDHGNVANGYAPNQPLSDDGFSKRAKFNGAVFQQAYAFGKFSPAGHDVTVKVGRQLLLWGRSLFTRGSYSAMNAIDLPAFHRPGSEYDQYLIPAGMFDVDAKLTDSLDAEAYYQFDWRRSVTDGCGTFYDTFDNVAPGCYATFSNSVVQPDAASLGEGLYFRRGSAHKGNDGGQYGLKLQYTFDQKSAHVGAYFFNYDARLPIYSVHKNADPRPTAAAPAAFNSVTFHYDYPNDIKVYGLTADKTFANVGNLALNLSYVDDLPLQINTPDLTTEAVTSSLAQPGDPRIPNGTKDYVDGIPLGADVPGAKRMGVERAELTFTTIIPSLLRASKTLISAETAFENIPGLPDQRDIRFGRHTNFGVGLPGADGYVTDFSWGYQVSIESTYPDVFAGMTLKPSFVIRQGVDGFSSDNAFQEHQRTLTGGLGFERGNFEADVSYTNYNTTHYSTIQDRDYVALSTSYNF